MLAFIVRRVVWTIPVILLVIFMTFMMMRQIKGNPFRTTERAVPASIQRNLDRKYHLDQPWYVQYVYYVKGVFTADLGPSLVQRNQTVNDVIKEHFPVSLKLGGLAMLWAVLLGVPLGIIAALKQNSIFDYAAMAFVEHRVRGPDLPDCNAVHLLLRAAIEGLHGLPDQRLERLAVVGPALDRARSRPDDVLRAARARHDARDAAAGLRPDREGEGTALAAGGRRPRAAQLADSRGHGRRPLLGFLITGSFIVESIFGIPGIGRYFVISVTGGTIP